MKMNTLLICIIVLLVSACSSNNSDTGNTVTEEIVEDTGYECDGREYCSEMDSYEEAKFFLDNCPNVKMDGDNDGIPCETQFNR